MGFKKKNKGFSLVEILVTIVIMSIIVGGVGMNLQGIFGPTYDAYREQYTLRDLLVITDAVHVYKKINGKLPANIEELFDQKILLNENSSIYGTVYSLNVTPAGIEIFTTKDNEKKEIITMQKILAKNKNK